MDIRGFFKKPSNPKKAVASSAPAPSSTRKRKKSQSSPSKASPSSKKSKRIVISSSDDDDNNDSGEIEVVKVSTPVKIETAEGSPSSAENRGDRYVNGAKKKKSASSQKRKNRDVGVEKKTPAKVREKTKKKKPVVKETDYSNQSLPDFSAEPAAKPKRKWNPSMRSGGGGGGDVAPPLAGRKPKPKVKLHSLTKKVFDKKTKKDKVVPLTFVFTGVSESLERHSLKALVVSSGGRVTTGVSGKTDYLVVGVFLEDGRPVNEGSKYRKAIDKFEKTCKLINETDLFKLIDPSYDPTPLETAPSYVPPDPMELDRDPMEIAIEQEERRAKVEASRKVDEVQRARTAANGVAVDSMSVSQLKDVIIKGGLSVKDCISKSDLRNRAKEALASPTSSGGSKDKSNVSSSSISEADRAALAERKKRANMQLWSTKHRPREPRDLVGNTETIQRLTRWLKEWRSNNLAGNAAGGEAKKKKGKSRGVKKAVLLSGPPGIGKTSAAMLVAQACGFEAVEFNASDKRSEKAIKEIHETTNSCSISSAFRKGGGGGGAKQRMRRRVLIMDEVDGMGGGDRGGCKSLSDLIKTCRSPVICICNDVQSQKIRTLKSVCIDLPFRRPSTAAITDRMMVVAKREGMVVERQALFDLVQASGNDIRQVLNALQMHARSSNTMSSSDVKKKLNHINKDAILKYTPFDGAKMILQGKRPATQGGKSLKERIDGFFIDFGMVPLLVQDNYIDTCGKSPGPSNKTQRELDQMKRLALAADAIAEADIVGSTIGSTQNYSLLPAQAMLNVKAGFHAAGTARGGGMTPSNYGRSHGGFFGGFPSWFGKNSKRTKHRRLLAEMATHVNSVAKCNAVRLRMDYFETMRVKILMPLFFKKQDGVLDCLALMQEYGLSREDVFEAMQEIHLCTPGSGVKSSQKIFEQLDTKTKRAFTSMYNKRGFAQATQSVAASTEKVTSATFKRKIPAKELKARLKKLKAEVASGERVFIKEKKKGKGKGKGKRKKAPGKASNDAGKKMRISSFFN
eukprot:g3135.t1